MKNPGVNFGELYGSLVPDFKLVSIKDHEDDTDDIVPELGEPNLAQQTMPAPA